MSFEEDLAAGHRAVELGWLDADDLERCAEAVVRQRPCPSLVIALMDHGIATAKVAFSLLRLRDRPDSRPAGPGSAPPPGTKFGDLALALELVPAEEINLALAVQRLAREEGRGVRIGEILVDRGAVDPHRVEELLRLQGKRVLLCERCLVQYNAWEYSPRHRFRCPGCGHRLHPRPFLDTLQAADTLVGEEGETSVDQAAAGGAFVSAQPGAMTELVDGATVPSASSHQGPALGAVVGGYALERLLGQGACGRVYLGRHEILEKPAAIKILRGRHLKDPRAVARFFQEARAVARLEHRNIVQVLDAKQDGDVLCIVMEYVEGPTLGTLIREKRLGGPAQACRYLRDAARALAYAHERGIVHRDVKPDNILVAAAGPAKVTDFGLAREIGGVRLTQAGRVLGTPFYMSPEQCCGAEITGQADVYSLGVCLYYSATGVYPFTGATPMRVIAQHLAEDPEPPESLVPGFPRGLSRLILDMMRKKPARRPTARQVAERLGEFAQEAEPMLVAPRSLPPAPGEPAIPGTGRTCTFCEAENAADRRRCWVCGEPLGDPGEIEIGMHEDEKVCGACGQFIQKLEVRCPFCHARICESCSTLMPAEAAFCPECGSGNSERQAVHAAGAWWRKLLGEGPRADCPACGVPLAAGDRLCGSCGCRNCPSCGRNLDPRCRYCPDCGKAQTQRRLRPTGDLGGR